jgi:uncharacterized protein
MTLIASLKTSKRGSLVVVTDQDIINKVFEEGRKQLNLTSSFYTGETKSKEEVKELLKNCTYAHFTGKEAIAIGIEMELINPQRILYIQDVPHAEVVVEK